MKFRSTIIYLTLAVGLGLFVYFYEIRGGREREEAKENEKKLLQVEEGLSTR